jgi:hypothetical protein
MIVVAGWKLDVKTFSTRRNRYASVDFRDAVGNRD